LDNEHALAPTLFQLVNQSHAAAVWWAQNAPQAVPFFLGLILGEFIVGSFWSVFCAIIGHPVYTFWI
jgi:hypothetical protein